MPDIDILLEGPWPPTKSALHELESEICVDAYDDGERSMAFGSVIDEYALLPVSVVVRGSRATWVEVGWNEEMLLAVIDIGAAKGIRVPLGDVQPAEGTPAAFLVACWRVSRGQSPW